MLAQIDLEAEAEQLRADLAEATGELNTANVASVFQTHGIESGGNVTIQLWDGSTWTDTQVGTVSETYWYGADVAYEQLSGDGIVVWNDNSQAAGNQLRFSIRVFESDPSLEREALLQKIRRDLTGELGLEPGQVHLSGMLVLYNNMLQSLFSSQIKTLGVVFLAILIMFAILFRNIRMALVAIIPNLFSGALVLGLMGWLNIRLDLMTITIAAITIGIAVDDTSIYITGSTESPDFVTANPIDFSVTCQGDARTYDGDTLQGKGDGFVVRYEKQPSLALADSTYLGGQGNGDRVNDGHEVDTLGTDPLAPPTERGAGRAAQLPGLREADALDHRAEHAAQLRGADARRGHATAQHALGAVQHLHAELARLERYIEENHFSRESRVAGLEEQMRQALTGWSLRAVVEGLMALRGVSLITAMTVLAELGDISRFDSPRQLMAYLGLVPSEHSSGASRRQGAITKSGNSHVRRVLVEAAWNYRFPARIGESLQPRLEGQPQTIIDLAWKAQLRLCHRFRRLRARGLHQNKVCAAIARELAGFVWDICRRVVPQGD